MSPSRQLDRSALEALRVDLLRTRQAHSLLVENNSRLTEHVRLLNRDNSALQAELETLRAQNAALQEQVRELTRRLNQNSSNSSKPPSSDPPDAREKRRGAASSGRKPGGQPGHPGVTGVLLPPTKQIVPCLPDSCQHCGQDLAGVPVGANDPWIHQVVELPPIQLEVTHFARQSKDCPCCGKATWGALPPGVPQRGVGPAFQGFCGLLTGRHRLSRRQARELLLDLFQWSPSVGTLCALERATAEALRVSVARVAAVVAAAAVANADETGWRNGKKRPTLWAIVTIQAILFRIGDRSRETLEGMLPPNDWRHLVSDRYVVYDGVPVWLRGLCWAHLKRNFAEVGERGGLAAAVARWAADEIKKLFAHWRRFQAGELTRWALQQEMVPVQEAFRSLLNMGAAGNCSKTAGFCNHLLERWDALWTFLRVEGVEPTNNAAERALRAAVLWRKGSFGHRSEDGKRFVESMLTVVATLRLQGRAILPFLTDACRAAITGIPPPEILPVRDPT